MNGCINESCIDPILNTEYWVKLYQIPVHTRCVGSLSKKVFTSEFVPNLPKWMQREVLASRIAPMLNDGKGDNFIGKNPYAYVIP